MNLDELDHKLPNGFHDMKIHSVDVDYATARIKLMVGLLVNWPEDPDRERDQYQNAVLTIGGLCFYSIDPPYPGYPFYPDGKAIVVSGDPAKSDHLSSLPVLSAQFPEGVWCYRFFVHDWNAFIHIAARDAAVTWIGPKPKHSQY
jgi:hypothetical protein